MTINDTDSFERIVGAEWPQESVISCGTGRMFSRDSLNGWIPPLYFIVKSTDQGCTRGSSCTITAASGRITEHGFNYSRKLTDEASLVAQRYLSRLVFRIQASRVAHNQTLALQLGQGGDPPPRPVDLLPHALLLRAAPHAQAQ